MNKIVSRSVSRIVASLWLSFLLIVAGAFFCQAEAADPPNDASKLKQAAATSPAGNSDQKKAGKESLASITKTVKVIEVANTRANNKDRAGVGDNIIVKVDSLKSLYTLAGNNLDNIKLKVDGKVIPGLIPAKTSDDNSLKYTLTKDSLNTVVWDSLFVKGKNMKMLIPVTVSLAIQDSVQNSHLDIREGSFKLVRPSKFNAILLFTGLILFALTFLKLDKFCPWCTWWKCDARLRDYGPDSTYSLARVQMALWYYVVTMSFLYLYFSSGFCVPILNESVLWLLGISTATKLGASVVDASKQNEQKDKEQKKEEDKSEKSQVVSKNAVSESVATNPDCHHRFIMDILSDEYGVNLTRFQNVVWTLILVVIFIIKVANEGDFPDFSNNPHLLTLMGISSGSYVLYKLKEAVP